MGFCVCGGAVIKCVFGTAPSILNVLPAAKVMSTQALASIMDQKPLMNILPFGMCSSMANPTVAAATAAALGVLTPMPCMPVTPGPWAPGNPTILVGGYPALTSDSKLMCSWAGSIDITFAGTTDIMC